MAKKKKQQQEEEKLQEQFKEYRDEDVRILRKKSIKEVIAPSGIDASHIDHLEIISILQDMLEVFLYHLFLECVLFQK